MLWPSRASQTLSLAVEPFHGVTRSSICRSLTGQDESPVDMGDHRMGRRDAELIVSTEVSLIGDQALVKPENRLPVALLFCGEKVFQELAFRHITSEDITLKWTFGIF